MPQPRKHRSNAERQAAYRRAHAGQPAPANAAPRKPVPRWKALLNQARAALETVTDEMREYYDARSQPWQESERGESFLERMEALQESIASLEEALES